MGELIDMYLIDTDAIRKLLKNCSSSLNLPIAVMISENYTRIKINEILYNVTIFTDKSDFLQLKSTPSIAEVTFDIFSRQTFQYRQDYQRVGNILIPVDMRKFIEFHDRSRMIPCLKKNMNRSKADSKQQLPPKFEKNLDTVRDALIDMGIMPYLTDGTLLGWYRECSFIPHTLDADFAVSRHQNQKDLTDRLNSLPGYKLYRRLERNDDQVYTHGLDSSSRKRVKWIVPRPKGFCSGIHRGKLFFVPCNIEETIATTYGVTWGSDHPTSQFNWMKSSQNAVEYGTFTKEEMKKYYIIY